MVKLGVDIEEIGRFKESYADSSFLNKVYTKRELDYCLRKKEPWICLAGRYCAKEACVKALGGGVAINDVDVVSDAGRPVIFVKGEVVENASCSISHTENYAVAVVLID